MDYVSPWLVYQHQEGPEGGHQKWGIITSLRWQILDKAWNEEERVTPQMLLARGENERHLVLNKSAVYGFPKPS